MNEHKIFQIYKGNCFTKPHTKKYQKTIVFDLDETLGSFSDLYVLWCGLNKIQNISTENEQNEFNCILDIYPEFLRYGILNILEYLRNKKKAGECDKIYIYTNNKCQPPWVSLIIRYLDNKMHISQDESLFDKMICAFKINDKAVEFTRTTKDKTLDDLIKCTLLPKTTEICFVDNTYYNEMVNDKVYYIQPKAYYHKLNSGEIIERFVLSEYGKDFINTTKTLATFNHFMQDWFQFNGRNLNAVIDKKFVEVDVFVARKMMYHIKEFFYLTNRIIKTKKNRLKCGNSTRKIRR